LLLKHLPATQLSLINYAVPVVAVFMKEPVTLQELAGAVLVVAGVWAATRTAGRQEAG
jgi:drug/metabolite transporter (DMT)-like permease